MPELKHNDAIALAVERAIAEARHEVNRALGGKLSDAVADAMRTKLGPDASVTAMEAAAREMVLDAVRRALRASTPPKRRGGV